MFSYTISKSYFLLFQLTLTTAKLTIPASCNSWCWNNIRRRHKSRWSDCNGNVRNRDNTANNVIGTNRKISEQTNDAFADDLSAVGSLSNIKKWWNALCNLGPKFGFNPEASKCWLIVKPQLVKEAEELFENTKVNITIKGKQHLGATIGSQDYRDEYVINKTDQRANELNNLCETAKLEPQAAYSCFVSGFKHKLNYIMRTILDIRHLLKPRHRSNEIHTRNKDKPNRKKITFPPACDIWWFSNPDICWNIRRRIQELTQRHRTFEKQHHTTTGRVYCRSRH